MSKIKSNTAAKSTEAVEVAPKAKVVQNPANATARTTYEPVVHSTGTIGGKPARLAWYGTKYGCIEIEQADGSFVVHHDTAFGGMRSVAALEGLFDSVAPAVVADPAVIEIVEAPVPVVEFVAPAPSADVVEAVAVIPAAPKKGGKAKVKLVTKQDVEQVIAEVQAAGADLPTVTIDSVTETAPVVAAEPVYTTLDEVRAAHEAETRGACRASVLRALRVRAGEIALGVPAGGKGEKVKAERAPLQLAAGEHSLDFRVKAAMAHTDAVMNPDGSIFVSQAVLVACKFSPSAVTLAGRWDSRSGAHIASVALGYTPKFSVKAGGVTFTPIAK